MFSHSFKFLHSKLCFNFVVYFGNLNGIFWLVIGWSYRRERGRFLHYRQIRLVGCLHLILSYIFYCHHYIYSWGNAFTLGYSWFSAYLTFIRLSIRNRDFKHSLIRRIWLWVAISLRVLFSQRLFMLNGQLIILQHIVYIYLMSIYV